MYSNYEVIRLIHQDSNYHLISDYVAGEALGIHIIQQPNIEKEHFFSWVMQILAQMDFIINMTGAAQDAKNVPQHMREMQCRCITPFYIILKSDNTVALLNTEAKINRRFLSQIAEYPVIKKFQPDVESCDYFYSFGKTLQFILAKSNLSPKLTYGEERKLQKIISKCLTKNSKRKYRSFGDIVSDFPINQEKTNSRKHKRKSVKRLIRIAEALTLIFSWGISLHFLVTKSVSDEAYFELGLSCFVVEDYQKSLELLGNAGKSKISQYYQEMASYMYGTSEYTEAEMEVMLRKLVKDKEEFSLEEKICMIRIYNKIDTKYARSQVIKIGKEIMEDSEWNENKDEIREILADVYQREGKYEEALEQYEELLKNRYGEGMYKTMFELYEECGQSEEAFQLCVDGMFHNEKSTSLELVYISMLCQDKTQTKEEKEDAIGDIVQSHPELLEEQRFKSLQIQYGIKVEGENVWLEN